jgi:hypothetical protein
VADQYANNKKPITSTINNTIPESVQVIFRLQEDLPGSYMAGLTLRKNKHVLMASRGKWHHKHPAISQFILSARC